MYFDHNATTPMLPEVFEAMTPWLSQHYGNPSSVHRAGRLARQAIDDARAQVADLLGAQPGEVIFTSGGTEANNMALRCLRGEARSWIVGATEHAAVIDAAKALAGTDGDQCRVLNVDKQGLISSDELSAALRVTEGRNRLVSIMWANNETGVIQNIDKLGAIAREAGALMHTDAVQAAGKLPLNFATSAVDLLSISAHKLYGPKGVGALLRRRDIAVTPLLYGGGHEGGLRAGTENLAGIVGFGRAAALAKERMQQRQQHASVLRERLEAGLRQLPGVHIFAQAVARVPNTCQFGVDGFHSEALLMELDKRDIAVTSGSACHAGSGKPTHVLLAMHCAEDLAHSAVRVSFGEQNTALEVDQFLAALQDIVQVPAAGFASGLFA
ncbi:MAG: cysteine desulfurase family protein [Oceanococcus sp.]